MIRGIETIHCTPTNPKTDVVIVLKDLNKEDVPVGSEVWSIEA
ncbi:MAG: hypothetical protein U0800_18915 [Isosphaeraceae bacterium]